MQTSDYTADLAAIVSDFGLFQSASITRVERSAQNPELETTTQTSTAISVSVLEDDGSGLLLRANKNDSSFRVGGKMFWIYNSYGSGVKKTDTLTVSSVAYRIVDVSSADAGLGYMFKCLVN
jgi:hypothetical protein